MRLPFDVARYLGETEEGICKVRSECRRYTERETAHRLTLFFEPPIDGCLETGCELKIDLFVDANNMVPNA